MTKCHRSPTAAPAYTRGVAGPHLSDRSRARTWAAVAAALALGGCAGSQTGVPSPPPGKPVPPARATGSPLPASGPPHVMLIVLENREYDDVIGATGAPYLNSLAVSAGLATDYHARAHPSLPNYLDLISGSTHGITSDCTGCQVVGDTLVDQLARRGIGWTAYMEGLPGSCFAGAASDGYAKRHNPFAYFPQLGDQGACHQVVPLERLGGDLGAGRASPFLWVSPDLCDDGHEAACGLRASDRWLSAFLPSVTGSGWYASGGAVIITWDEGTTDAGCCRGAGGGHVATLVLSAAARPGARLDSPVSHAGTLRTLETLYGLPLLGEAACPCSGDLLPLLGR